MVSTFQSPPWQTNMMNWSKEEGEADKGRSSVTVTCTVLRIDHSDLYYRVCSLCERALPSSSASASASASPNDPSSLCKFCHPNNPSSASASASKRLFRVLMSVATDSEVFTVICFDRVVRILFGCSADEFFDFAKLHPFSGVTVNEILEGEMFTMTLSKPVNLNAQHVRVTSAVPLSSVFRPAIQVLRECYGSPHSS